MNILKKIAILGTLVTSLGSQCFAQNLDLDLDIGVSISDSRKFLEFTVVNYESKSVFCEYIKQRAEYVDASTGAAYGYRVVSIRNITIKPDPTDPFFNPQGGKEIIETWEAANRFAVIKEVSEDYEAKCSLVPDPVVPPPVVVTPPAPVCRWEARPLEGRTKACGTEDPIVFDHVFTPWSSATSANVKALCPNQPADVSKSTYHVVSGGSRNVTVRCERYKSCVHPDNGTTQVQICQ